MQKKLLLTLTAAALAAALTACGAEQPIHSDAPASSSSPDASVTTEASAPPETTAPATDLPTSLTTQTEPAAQTSETIETTETTETTRTHAEVPSCMETANRSFPTGNKTLRPAPTEGSDLFYRKRQRETLRGAPP